MPFRIVNPNFLVILHAKNREEQKSESTLAGKQEHGIVTVLPQVVVEVAYNEIQKSPKYKSEMALRFARITRIRNDKTAAEADTIQKVRKIYERQFANKGRYKADTH